MEIFELEAKVLKRMREKGAKRLDRWGDTWKSRKTCSMLGRVHRMWIIKRL